MWCVGFILNYYGALMA